jgi:hypothetical protein
MRLTRAWPLLAASFAVLPATATADARDFPGHSLAVPSDHFGHGPHLGTRFHHHHHNNVVVVFPSPFFYIPPAYDVPPVYAPPPVMYLPPAESASPAAYGPAANAYAPPPPAPTGPPPPPTPRTVEFGSGHYELRGDGVNSPYVWVWVPNPPTAPPPSSSAPSKAPTIYRWTDERGVTTWTDDLQKVPVRFRAQATQTRL